MSAQKDPFETLPCNHVHVRYGACTLRYDHWGRHRWINGSPWTRFLLWYGRRSGSTRFLIAAIIGSGCIVAALALIALVLWSMGV